MANSQTITINVKAIADMKDVLSNVNSIQQALSKMKLPANLKSSFNDTFKGLEKEVAKYQELLEKKNPGKSDLSALEKSGAKISKLYDDIIQKMGSIDDKTLKAAFKDLGTEEVTKLKQEISDLQTQFSNIAKSSDFTKGLKDGFAQLKQDIGKTSEEATNLVNHLGKATFSTFFKNLESGKFDLAAKNLESIRQQIDALGESAEKDKLKAWVESLDKGFTQLKSDSNLQDLTSQLEQLKTQLTGSKAEFVQKLIDGFKNGTIAIGETKTSLDNYINTTNKGVQAQADLNSELNQVKSRIQYFLGLNNAVNLFRRAVRQAFNTVKELDKAMTETAVVTNFTIGDMWAQLPRYTQTANELGVTTQGAYETMTLFYQQGLDTNEAFAIGTETMKMARIAGLDYADATDAMTAALRGFNMELNDTSAQRVNDVYSQLAAKTASNVEEISTAMTKTASIAHNAGMEFETTAAYLSQIIETTREAPETAGTALKTVIARFTELKKPLAEIGEVEGEAVDANKIETALKSVGVALRDTQGQFRNLDDVFMDLNARWDSLTKNQQRYVATMAAGSRQQSRFIAMMSNYSRTQELIGEAYDSAGASQKQYEKTLDSLESKLNRLKNAWNEFLMGITDNSLIKGFVDMLTNLINGINKFSDLFGKNSGLVKVLMTLVAWKGLRSLLGKSGGLIGQLLGGKTKEASVGITKIITGIGTINSKLAQATLRLKEAGGAFNVLKLSFTGGLTNITSMLGETSMLIGQISGFLLPILGIVLAIGAAIYAGYQIWKQFSFAGRIKQAQELQKSFENIASSAQDTKDSLQEVSDTYQELTQAIEDATNAEERAAAIQERNDYVNKTLQENQDYAKFLKSTMDIDGKLNLTLDEDALANSIAKAQEAITRANAGISFAGAAEAGLRAQQAQKQMDRYDFNKETGKVDRLKIDDAVIQYAGETQERATNAYINYMTTAEQATTEMIQQATNGYLQMLEGKDLEGSTAEGIARLMAENFDITKFSQTTANWGIQNWEQYASLIEEGMGQKVAYTDEGYTFSNEQLRWLYSYYTGQVATSAPTVDWGGKWAKSLWDEINLASYNQDEEKRLDNLVDLVNSNEDLYNSIFSAIDSFENTNQNLLKLGNASPADILGIDSAEYKRALGLIANGNEEQYKKLDSIIQQNLQYARQQQAEKITGTSARIAQLRGPQTALDFMQLDRFDWQEQVASLLDQVDGLAFGDTIAKAVINSMKTGDWDDSALQGWINSIDFSNPISAMRSLQLGVANTNSEISNLSSTLLSQAEVTADFSNASQLQYFLTSEAFSEMSEDLDEFIEENGRITPDKIDELRKSSADLDNLLKNSAISANGLANALTAIQQGNISILDLDNALIAAADSMHSLDNMVAETIDDLNSFDPGFDENDVTGFISKAYEFANEQIEKGAYGNNAMKNYMLKIFGEDAFDDLSGLDIQSGAYADAYEARLNEMLAWLKANKDNMLSAWRDVEGSLQVGIDGVIDVYESGGNLIIESNGHTTEQLIQALVDTGKVTETQARMMIADYKNYSADFAQEMAQNDMPDAIANWADALGTNAKNGYIYTKEQLDALRKLLGGTLTNEDIINEAKEFGYELQEINWDTSSKEAARQSVSQLGQDLTTSIDLSTGIESVDVNKIIDFDAIKSAMNQANLAGQFESTLDAMVVEGDSFVAEINGQMQTITVAEGQTAMEAYNAAVEAAANDALAEAIASALANVPVDLDPEAANTTLQSLIDTINNVSPEPIDIKADLSAARQAINAFITAQSQRTITLKTKASRDTGASGGYVSSYASGTHKLKPGIALTGEEGPEIVWNKEKGYAYITGSSNPEFQNLQAGDRVFNAQETKKILGTVATGGKVPSYARGYGVAIAASSNTKQTKTTVSGTKKSSSSGSKVTADAEFWENELDWLYNLLEDIAALEQEQNQFEALQDAYLADSTKSGKDLYNLLVKQLGNLQAQLLGNQELLTRREQEMAAFMEQTNRFPDLLKYNWNDRTLEIDWDAIDQLNKTDYDQITELISHAEKIQDEITDVENAVISTEQSLREFQNVWRNEYVNFEDRVEQALINSQQKIIDSYSELNDTLSDSNSKILNSLSESISLSRQIRDNTKTEEEIADMEARLAYLRRDTTGGNQAEIQKLEKELEDARQSYEDTLIDQALDRLKDENDAAAEQRQQEIDLMQAQLNYAEQSGEFNKEIRDLIESARDEGGGFRADSELMALLKEDASFSSKTVEAQSQWMDELLTTFKTVSGYVEKQEQESSGNFANEIAAVLQDEINKHDALPESSGTDRDIGSPNGDIGSQSQGAYHVDVNKDYTGWVQNEKTGDWYYTKKGEVQTGWIKSGSKWYYMDENRGGKMATGEITDAKGNIYWMGTSGAYTSGWAKGENGDWYYTKDGYAYTGWKQSSGVWYYIDHGKMVRGWVNTPKGYSYFDPSNGHYAGSTSGVEIDGETYYFNKSGYAQNLTDEQISAIEAAIRKRKGQTEGFLTGGLTSKTGLAWLDGTPSKPEYVLNAAQTQAFLKLADVLPSIMGTGGATTNNTFGGINLNLVMNVDEIGSDYDVDRIAARVKDIIYNAGSYRNVNTLNFLR